MYRCMRELSSGTSDFRANFNTAQRQLQAWQPNTCRTFRRKMYSYGFHNRFSFSNMRFVLKIQISSIFVWEEDLILNEFI